MHADKIPAALSFSQRGGEAIGQFQRRLPHALYGEDMRIRPGVPQYMADRRKLPPVPILGFIARQTQCQSLLQRQRRQHGPLPVQDVAQIPAFRYQVRDIEIPMDDSDWLTGIQAGDPRFHPVEQRAKRLPAAAQGGQALSVCEIILSPEERSKKIGILPTSRSASLHCAVSIFTSETDGGAAGEEGQ